MSEAYWSWKEASNGKSVVAYHPNGLEEEYLYPWQAGCRYATDEDEVR